MSAAAANISVEGWAGLAGELISRRDRVAELDARSVRDRIARDGRFGQAEGPPRVWALVAPRAGEANQVLALAEALGWPFEVKRFALEWYELLVAPPYWASRAGVDRRRSSELTPPWPDLVISAGRVNEPIARWIRKQSGGRTRLVHLGRTWGQSEPYDLIVTTPQYRLPAADNVLHNTTSLHRVTAGRLAAEAARWAAHLAELPRPYVAVLVGGDSGPYAMTRRSGERLAQEASALARRLGGSLLVTTSARTPPEVTEALATHIDVPHSLHQWQAGAEANPYFAFLGLADEIVVTGDSVSMMTEACATAKPVHLFDLGSGRDSMRAPLRVRGGALRTLPFRLAMRFLPDWITRDLRLVHRSLIASRRAVWLGDPSPAAPRPLDDVARAVAAVRALMSAGPTRRRTVTVGAAPRGRVPDYGFLPQPG